MIGVFPATARRRRATLVAVRRTPIDATTAAAATQVVCRPDRAAPKTMARILRFGRLLRTVRATDTVHRGRVAIECGYYDQAHLHRDVRALAGTTPTGLRIELGHVGGGLPAVRHDRDLTG